MSDRKAELERKKAKLLALREEKDRRRKEKEMKDVEEAASRMMGGAGDRRELDEMLSSLGVAPVSDILSSISSINSNTPDHSLNHTPDTSLQPNSLPNNVIVGKRKVPQLSVVAVQSTNIPPKETVLYTKQTQTTASGHERDVSQAGQEHRQIWASASVFEN